MASFSGKRAYNLHLARGKGISIVISACIYYVGRKFGYPITIKMLAESIDSSRTQNKENTINQCYRRLVQELHLVVPLRNPMDFIPLVVSHLKLHSSVEREALLLLQSIIPLYPWSGKNPMGMAGASVYLTCKRMNVKATKVEIANSLGITDSTLRVRIKEFQKLM